MASLDSPVLFLGLGGTLDLAPMTYDDGDDSTKTSIEWTLRPYTCIQVREFSQSSESTSQSRTLLKMLKMSLCFVHCLLGVPYTLCQPEKSAWQTAKSH